MKISDSSGFKKKSLEATAPDGTRLTFPNVEIERSALKVIENAPICTFFLDKDRKVIFANAAMQALLGYSESECLTLALDDLIHEVNRDSAIEEHRNIITGAKNNSVVERVYNHKNGAPIPVVASKYLYTEAYNPQPLVVVQLTDLSQQKKFERELAISDERSKFALQSAYQGVWDSNLITGEMFHSDIWFEIRGFEPGDKAAARNWRNRLHPDDKEYVMKIAAERRMGIFNQDQFEYREKHRNGDYIWILSYGRAIEFGPGKRPTRIIGTDTDITRIKETEKAHEQMSERLKLALRTSKVGVWELNLNTGAERWDAMMKNIHGCPDIDGENIPKGLWESFVHPSDSVVSELNYDGTPNNAVFRERKFRIIRSDNTIRHIESIARKFQDGYGVKWLIGTDRDVTDEMIAADELEIARKLAELRNADLETARAQMEYNALHDALTDLPNRRYLDQKLDALSKGEVTVGILHMDIDHFKQINDTLGHAAGDGILVHCADVLRKCVKNTDFLARVGGDEFVVCITGDHSLSDLQKLASRIITRMREPILYEGHECRFGVSIGIAQSRGVDIAARSTLVNADIALYRAKRNGRSSHQVFTPELQQEVSDTKRIADQVLVAIETDQFEPYYQLQFDAKTLDVVGVEALARWNHPEEGLVGPEKFLKVAEGLNVISTIDRIILQKSLNDFETWRELGLNIPKIAVNVSSKRLRDEELIKHLDQVSFTPGTLSFELLESIFLDDDDDSLICNVNCIKDMGIEVVVDDFGTGHASIVGLLKIAPSCLKIDRQLIAPIGASDRERLLAKSIIEIGKSLGIRVLAEGVETPEQVAILRDLDCDLLQGFLFCKPLSNDAMQSYVAGQSWRSQMPSDTKSS